jgi:hypothetical protein
LSTPVAVSHSTTHAVSASGRTATGAAGADVETE